MLLELRIFLQNPSGNAVWSLLICRWFRFRGRSQTTLTRLSRYLNSGTGNVYSMKMFPYNSRGIHSQIPTRGSRYHSRFFVHVGHESRNADI